MLCAKYEAMFVTQIDAYKGWTIRYPGRGVADQKKNSCKELD